MAFAVRTIAVASLIVVLAACQVSITLPPGIDFSASAQPVTNEPTIRQRLTLEPGESVVGRIQFPASQSGAAPLLNYVEIEASGAMRLELLSSSGSTQLVSTSRRGFARTATAAPSSLDLDSTVERSITVPWDCFGPCIATPYASGNRLVRITNESTSRRSVNVYAYVFEVTDEFEPNDTFATAERVDLPTGSTQSFVRGAIEHVDDRDYFWLECTPSWPFEDVEVTLEVPSFTGVIELVSDDGGLVARDGQMTVGCGETIVVRSGDGSAGPSGESLYFLYFD